MARRTSETRIEDIAQLIQSQSGLTASGIADLLGLSPSSVLRALPDLEASGYLLTEDDYGQLGFFGQRR